MENNLIDGIYTISCTKCGKVIFGPEESNRETITEKRNQMMSEGFECPNHCFLPKLVIEMEPIAKPPKYNAEHPYGIDSKDEEENRRGVRRKPMELEEAYDQLEDAYKDFTQAKAMSQHIKVRYPKEKRKWEAEADVVINRVRNIFLTCPILWDFVREDFFQPNYFETDFDALMDDLEAYVKRKADNAEDEN